MTTVVGVLVVIGVLGIAYDTTVAGPRRRRERLARKHNLYGRHYEQDGA